jgi:hypothetical protein
MPKAKTHVFREKRPFEGRWEIYKSKHATSENRSYILLHVWIIFQAFMEHLKHVWIIFQAFFKHVCPVIIAFFRGSHEKGYYMSIISIFEPTEAFLEHS